jgi:argininosuccinate lyase
MSTATDLADALAAEGIPFREAHEVVGKVVRGCIAGGRALEDLTLEDLRNYDSRFGDAALAAIQPPASVDARRSVGGTAREAVQIQLGKARAVLGDPAIP